MTDQSGRTSKTGCVFLVSCVKEKKKCKAPAKELYISDLFKKSRKLVEATKFPWFILSAKHGLLHPDKVICPYNEALNDMKPRQRKEWAEKVKKQMNANFPDTESVVFLAGKKYYEHLVPYLEERPANVKILMEGMKIGKRLSWLKKANVKNILP